MSKNSKDRAPVVVVLILAALLVVLIAIAIMTGPDWFKDLSSALQFQSETQPDVAAKSDEAAVIETRFGEITLEFFPDAAPNHVDNFKKLVREGFYDSTTFHRVIPGFIIQGGDPNSKDDDRSNDGQGGPGYTIKAEFNELKHLRGTLSMARSRDPNSAGSQFFICIAPQPALDGQYTVFGRVIQGMDVVDRIVNLPRDQHDNPLEPVPMQKVTIVPRSQIE